MVNLVNLATDFSEGKYDHQVEAHVWVPVFKYLIEHAETLSPQKDEIQKLWIVSGGRLRDKVRDDELVLQVLKLYLPGYEGNGVDLYRGECKFLFERGKVGFCWTPKREIAETFASGLNAIESGGVLLKGYAPPKAILAGPIAYSWTAKNEVEYTCDPTLLCDVEAIKEYPRSL